MTEWRGRWRGLPSFASACLVVFRSLSSWRSVDLDSVGPLPTVSSSPTCDSVGFSGSVVRLRGKICFGV